MKRLTIAFLACCLVVQTQQKIGPWVGLRIPVYDFAKGGYWYLKANMGQFQIDPDPAKTSDGILSFRRKYGLILTRDVSGNYPLPVQSNVVIYRNGLRQTAIQDYIIAGGFAATTSIWSADDLVVCDGE